MTGVLSGAMRRVMWRRSFPEHLRDAVPHEAGSVAGLPKMGHVHDMEAIAASADASRKQKPLTAISIPQPESTWTRAADARRAAQQQSVAEWECVRERAASQAPRHSGDLEVRVFVRASMEHGRPEMLMEIQRETLDWRRR